MLLRVFASFPKCKNGHSGFKNETFSICFNDKWVSNPTSINFSPHQYVNITNMKIHI